MTLGKMSFIMFNDIFRYFYKWVERYFLAFKPTGRTNKAEALLSCESKLKLFVCLSGGLIPVAFLYIVTVKMHVSLPVQYFLPESLTE